MEKWDLYPETESLREFTQEQRMQVDLDSPMNLDFHAILHLNGKDLNPDNGCGTATTPVCPRSIPWETRPDWLWNTMAWTQISWMLWRSAYPWATKRKPEIRSLSLTIIQDPVSIPGPHFQVRCPGDTAVFSHGGTEHILTVQEYEAQAMDWSRMPDTGWSTPATMWP